MRVAMLNLTGGGLSGGYRKYLQRLVPLLRESPDIELLLQVVPPGNEALPGLGADVWSWTPGEQWKGFSMLRERVRAWKPDVVLVPTARYLDCHAPCVSMVRNMEPMLPPTFRDGVSAWAKNRAGAYLARRSATRSAQVIAVSQFVRDFLVNEWALDGNRVGVVYHGVDAAAPIEVAPPELHALNNTPFLFAAGSLLPYRGVEDAISALGRVNPSMLLAIAGDGSATYRARMQQLAHDAGVANRVLWLGYLNDRAMSWAYQRCCAFLMTSRVEACPNTALEAMANGALCISTRSLPMPEFFDDASLYYDTGNAEQLAKQVSAALEMDAQSALRLRERARQRALDFTWQQTARGTVELLKKTVAGRRQ